MPPKVQPKDTRTPEQIAIESAKNSNYNLMIPMTGAKYVRVRNPLTGKDPHFSTSDISFYQLLSDLASKGLREKIEFDFTFFAENYDPAWNEIKNNFIQHILSSDTSTE